MQQPDGAGRPVTFDRRRFLAGGGAALATAAVAGAGPWTAQAAARAPRRQPNIVLVLADDLGYGELGCYGQEQIHTPNLDRLAAEGVRYTNCYAGGPVCAPSRCTMLTGMHTGHSTVRNNPEPGMDDEPLRPDEVTFGTLLQAVGYRTALFGKWGFSPDEPGHYSHPNEQGFDEFFGYLTHAHAHDYHPAYLWHNDTRVSLPENEGNATGSYAPDLFVQRSLDFIDGHRDQPFLLFLSTNMPHFPQVVPDLGPYADAPWAAPEKAHAAQITRMDAHTGRLVDKLEEHGIADDTVLVFLSDNGPHEEGSPRLNPEFFEANGPLRGYKRNLYEGGIRVPAIVWAPGLRRPSAVSDHVCATWDLLPTFADLAGAPVPPFVDGRSIRGTLARGPAPAEPDHLYWWRLEPYSSPRAAAEENGRVQQAAEAIRRGDWKAIRYAPGRDRDVPDASWDVELYDLATDVGETTDVAAAHPEVASALVALMHAAWTPPPMHRPAWSPNGLTVDAPAYVGAGRAIDVPVTFTNHGRAAATRVELGMTAPAGWTVERLAGHPRVVSPGGSIEAVFRVVAGTAGSGAVLSVAAAFRRAGRVERALLDAPVTLAPAPPTETSYVSDLQWLSATNGWGPVERDAGNGRNGAGDGPPIGLGGRVYDKGLGVHARSEVVFYLGGACDRFTSDVGIDDFSANQGLNGSVVFRVVADGRTLYDSGVLRAATGPRSVDVPLAGVQLLRLVVTDGGNGNTHDHASWADAVIHC